ncbi:MAG: class I SAM-dependent rRNA methyltransferase [Halioglobus sp.]|nr:class I SAM-dependent rRNA methyltransferase [Halioglobus sp.]
MNSLFLRRGAERRLRGGHLWVYSNEVDTERSRLTGFAAGDAVAVRDNGGHLMGSAYMDPQSLICARLYTHREERALDRDFCVARLRSALALRERFFDLPYYRLIYGDSDGLPGVVLDRYGECLVLQLNNPGLEPYREVLRDAIAQVLAPAAVLLRRDSRSRREQGGEDASETLLGTLPEQLSLEENGCLFRVPASSGQKTGWFYDHRLSRARLAQLAAGARVLDVYCYMGGWGLQAAVAGARDVSFVDSSAPALDAVLANAALNGVAERVRTLRGGAPDVMSELRAAGERFDIVVLDPPAFVQRRKDLKKGITAYRRINELALGLLEPGGLLVSASCSMHLARADLIGAMQQAAVRAGCALQIVEQGGQGPDHPVHPAIPETEYLKTVFARKAEGL